MHYLYVLECSRGHLYLGVTVDPRERLAAHQSGKAARFTREHPPRRMVYVEPFARLEEAERVERALVRHLSALRHPLSVAGGPISRADEPARAPSEAAVRAARLAERELEDHPRATLYAWARKPAALVEA